MKILESSQNWTSLKGVISMHFRAFPYGQGIEWGYFWVAKIQIFLGRLSRNYWYFV